jgi:hypothetical protein
MSKSLLSSARLPAFAALMLAAPALAQAEPLTPVRVFAHAAPFAQAVMLGLAAATVAAIAICARRLRDGPALVGGSAFLSSLRLGGPLAGALGASYTLLNMTLGLSNVAETPPIKILAPGFAEAVLLIGLGFCAGATAAVCHWAVEARIDRAVLKAR